MANAGGWAHDHFNSSAPFTVMTLLDLSMFIALFLGFGVFGAGFRNPKPAVVSEEQ